MAEGGSSPLRDPGGLHMYNINGGTHKLAELIPQPSMGVGLSNPSVNDLGLFSDNMSSAYQTDTGLQNNSYIQVEPLKYNDQIGMFDEMKRQPTQMHSQAYFTNLDNLNNPNMYEQGSENSFAGNSDLYKASSGNLGGYIEMLGNSDSLMNIKQEKPDYNDHINLPTNNHSPETSYATNTCVGDWNYYNAVPNTNNYHEVHPPNAGNYSMFNIQSSVPSFNPPPSYSGTNMQSTLPSNVDIHNQSKKITQSILGLDWNQENLYKSRLYSNIEVENTTRKRKNENTGQRGGKSRRKRSNELGSHSKTVASILMSDDKSSVFKKDDSASKSPVLNVLDSAERNSLVTKLMDNLRTTVQFESFCLSFPRTKKKENAFRRKVLATANLVQSIPAIDVRSGTFPVNYLMGATKLLANFNMALKKTGTKNASSSDDGNECNTENKNASVSQVEENLPHSIFWVLKIGDHLISANWEGQFVMAMNPVLEVLTVSIFQFQPNFTMEGITCLQQCKLSKDLAKDILENMEMFEVSRQLRCDINLKKVVQLYLYKPYDEQNEGCLIIEVSEKPQYYQRWLHTSAIDKNKWQERNSFLSKASDSSSNYTISIGGLVSELNEVVALMLANNEELKEIYEVGKDKSFEIVPSNGFTAEGDKLKENGDYKTVVSSRSQRHKKCIRKLGSNVIKLRKEIVEVLKANSITDLSESPSNNLDVKEEGNVDVSLGLHFNPQVCGCFSDYVNYSCDSASELNSILNQKIQPKHHGYYENDFELEKVPNSNIDELTVGTLMSSKCSDAVYFSFCTKVIGQVGYDHHCSACRKCRTMHYWHCNNCDQCSESVSICVFCGHIRNDQSRSVIKPLSVFRSQLVTGTISEDDIKEQWVYMLNLPDEDVLDLNNIPCDVDDTDSMEYNSSNAMVDQLGLLNPVGFLLGQPLTGASRRYRRHKGVSFEGKSPAKSASQTSTGSSCSVQ
ncbi:hypothetical protein ACF0H5_001940 [Mactra antiquata]